jgi:hypothetical protein
VKVVDRQTGAETVLLSGTHDSTFIDYQGWRHTNGFGFRVRTVTMNVGWRSGQVVTLPGFERSFAGDWSGSMIHEEGTVLRTNLATGAVETVSTLGNRNVRPEVAENGDIVWTEMDSNVYRARVGQPRTAITTFGRDTSFMLHPITDGVNVAFLHVPKNLPKRLYLYTAAGQLVDLGDVSIWQYGYPAHTNFELRNGWTAYLRPDAGSFRQVWTRSPAGELRQVTFAGSHSEIRAVGRNGEVIYANGGSVYSARYPYTAAPVRLFANSPSHFLRWNGDQLLLFLGRTAFDVAY